MEKRQGTLEKNGKHEKHKRTSLGHSVSNPHLKVRSCNCWNSLLEKLELNFVEIPICPDIFEDLTIQCNFDS